MELVAALRVDCNLPDRSNMTFWHYLDEPLAPAGRFRFRIDPIEDANRAADQAFRGTTVLLARLCVGPPGGPAPVLPRPISNLRAEVVEPVELTGSGRLG